MIEVVCATRRDAATFNATPLGISLDRLRFDERLVRRIAFTNVLGLPAVYNAQINAQSEFDILLFVHDDVWLDDYFVTDRIIDGLAENDVIGIAGNTRIPPQHAGWCFRNLQWDWDVPNLSGAVAHGGTPYGLITEFGPLNQSCELMDGVLLATRRSVLQEADVEFDPQFTFHFYDLDFCRSARTAGLQLRTWPIAITHNSGGSFGTPQWQAARNLYRQKWP